MNPKQILATLLMIVVIVLAVTFYLKRSGAPVAQETPSTNTVDKKPPANVVAVSQYIMGNVSNLSPVKPAEGQKFSVTKVQYSDGSGTVEFGDGRNAYVADFDYTVDNANKVSVQSFIIRK